MRNTLSESRIGAEDAEGQGRLEGDCLKQDLQDLGIDGIGDTGKEEWKDGRLEDWKNGSRV